MDKDEELELKAEPGWPTVVSNLIIGIVILGICATVVLLVKL